MHRFAARSGLLDVEAAMRVFDHGRKNEPWYLLNLALWWKHYIANESTEDGRGR